MNNGSAKEINNQSAASPMETSSGQPGPRKVILETERLILREMDMDDFDSLKRFLGDPEVMYAYEHGFDDEEIRQWIKNNQKRYSRDGFGLWLMIEKKSGKSIGDCGITWQDADGVPVLEIGYHLEKARWHQGFAAEAARACKKLAFEQLQASKVTSIIRDSNLASQKVALANGMKPERTMIKQYRGMTMPHIVFAITRDQYEKEQAECKRKPAGRKKLAA